jgi:hypothetical protein
VGMGGEKKEVGMVRGGEGCIKTENGNKVGLSLKGFPFTFICYADESLTFCLFVRKQTNGKRPVSKRS